MKQEAPNVYAPPNEPVSEPEPEEILLGSSRFNSTHLAGRGTRLLARVLDWVAYNLLFVIVVVFVLVLLMILTAFELVEPGWNERVEQGGALLTLAGLVIYFAYHVIFEWLTSSSIGKQICGIRVVQDDGRPCTAEAAFLRGVGFWVDGFFFFLIAHFAISASPLNQRVGDRWANTVVVKKGAAETGKGFAHFLLALVSISAFSTVVFVAVVLI